MAYKLAHLLRRFPVVMVVLLVLAAMIAGRCGWHWHPGMWDGPI